MACAVCGRGGLVFYDLDEPSELHGQSACSRCNSAVEKLIAGALVNEELEEFMRISSQTDAGVAVRSIVRRQATERGVAEDARRAESRGTVRSRRARTYAMIDTLSATSKKYERALSGDRLAYASIIGTESWEDYASLSFTAMQAEALADIDMRIEAATAAVVHLSSRQERIIELLEMIAGADHSTPSDLGSVVDATLGLGDRQ